jgi:methionyl aminopeptidase
MVAKEKGSKIYQEKMILLKSEEQIELIKKAGRIAADTLSLLSSFVIPGKTGLEIDALAEQFIRDNGGIPSCKGYGEFPYSLCYARNGQGVHCFPDKESINEGDLVKLDLVVSYQGWNADTAISLIVPPARKEDVNLCYNTYKALQMGILQAKPGNRVSDISKAVFDARNGCGVVKPFTGHGIGKDIHEGPQIPNYIVEGKDALLVENMVICIEPIFTNGTGEIYYKKGEWPTFTMDGSHLAHFEHSILITSKGPEILTLRKDGNLNIF